MRSAFGLFAILAAASCGNGAAPGSDAGDDASPDGSPGGGLAVVFIVDEDADLELEDLVLGVEEVNIASDHGQDERLRDDTFRLIEPLGGDVESNRIVFDDAPPGTYSGVQIVLGPSRGGTTADVRGMQGRTPVSRSTSARVVWDLRCDEGVTLAPGGAVELRVLLDVDEWLTAGGGGGLDLEDGAHLECEAEDAEGEAEG